MPAISVMLQPLGTAHVNMNLAQVAPFLSPATTTQQQMLRMVVAFFNVLGVPMELLATMTVALFRMTVLVFTRRILVGAIVKGMSLTLAEFAVAPVRFIRVGVSTCHMDTATAMEMC